MTRLGLLVGEADRPVPLLGTTRVHCAALTDFVLGDS